MATRIEKVRQHLSQGDWAPAATLCEAIIRSQPGNDEAAYLLAVADLKLGRTSRAVALLERASARNPGHSQIMLTLGSAYLQAGQGAKAAGLYEKLAAQRPNDLDIKSRLALARFARGSYRDAITLYQDILQHAPNDVAAWNNLSAAQLADNQRDAAIRSAEKAIGLAPDAAQPRATLGHALHGAGQLRAAEEQLRAALASAGEAVLPEVSNGLGLVLAKQGRLDEALAIFQQLEHVAPSYVDGLLNHAQVLYESGYLDRALALFARAINLAPGATRPRFAAARVLTEVGRYADARGHLTHVLDDSAPAEVLTALGALDIQEGHYELAMKRFDAALGQSPDSAEALFGYLVAAQRGCRWDEFDQRLDRFLELFNSDPSVKVSPLAFIYLPRTTARDHLECATRQAVALVPRGRASAAAERRGKIRIGFLSRDFRDHPIGRLIVEVLESLRRDAFEWHAFSWGEDDHGDIRARIVEAFDCFHDISTISDARAVAAIREQGIDILIDLAGYTQQARPIITALRAANVQVNWLGHPQTLGPGMADYIIVDATICPEGEESDFSEKVLRMPHSYLPTPRRPLIGEAGTRGDHGLPIEGVVYGCFNQAQKITRDVFDLWCEILKAVSHGVLWLLDDNLTATTNLREQAMANDIDPDRIVFAKHVDHASHLARLSHMDVMLDTLYYNGHTTASDALSLNVPVITRPGPTFPSRVAASLLRACRLERLICASDSDYVKLAIELGKDSSARTAMRSHLAQHHDSLPLFDCLAFAREFENLMLTIQPR